MPTDVNLIQGHLDPADITYLRERASKARSILEIGCWHGKSTMAMAQVCPGTIHSIDVFAGCVPDRYPTWEDYGKDREAKQAFLRNMKGYMESGKVFLHEGISWECLRIMHHLGYTFDFAFIDGDHSFEGATKDIKGVLPLMREGGIIAGHDIHWSGVARAVTLLCAGWTRQGSVIWEWKHGRSSAAGTGGHDNQPSQTNYNESS